MGIQLVRVPKKHCIIRGEDLNLGIFVCIGSGTVQQINGRYPRVLLSGYLLGTMDSARNYVGNDGMKAAVMAAQDPYLLVVSEGMPCNIP